MKPDALTKVKEPEEKSAVVEGATKPVTIEDALRDLREQIKKLPKDDPFFKIKQIEVELAVVAERTVSGKAGIHWIVAAGAEAASKNAVHHKVRLHLQLLDDPKVNKTD